MAEFLSHEPEHQMTTSAYMKEWGVDMSYENRGATAAAIDTPSPRKIYLLKRSMGKHGKNLGKTTGWIHRASLVKKKVDMFSQCEYIRVDDRGFTIKVNEEEITLPVDHVVICAGQEVHNPFGDSLDMKAEHIHVVGGAKNAAGLDAKRAIREAAYLAAKL